MESTGAKEIFEASRTWPEGGVIMNSVIRDRDSDLMFKIRYVYADLGLCAECDAMKDKEASSKEWKAFS
jgi:hypothetical protein